MIVKAFEKIVKENGDRVAIETFEQKITYGQLNAAANIVAREILSQNPGRDHTAGILLEHGPEQVIALLAVLKARMIYVPLDPAYPQERLSRMVRDAGPGVIVTNNGNLALARQLCTQPLPIDEIIYDFYDRGESPSEPENPGPADSTAYILYTSGSTGKPKGVVQTDENLYFYTEIYINALSITRKDRVSYLSSFSHDGAVQDIYSAILSGAVLCPLDIRPAGKFNVTDIGDWLIKEKVTLYHSVPGVFRYAAASLRGNRRFPHLRLIVTGGEKLQSRDILLARKYFPAAEFAHMYGQTESSVNTMGFIDTRGKTGRITIGKPLGGIKLLLLNEEGEHVEPFEEGEIFVVSPHIARGYWKNPQASEKVFLFDEHLGAIYRTGDLGKLGIDGSIECIGRKDRQVKIRGFRVELGEIENQLLNNEDIKETVVIHRQRDSGETYLCAYIVPNKTVDSRQLRAFLSHRLPGYMIPDYFITIDKIPVNPNGKVDRKALPSPAITADENYKAPGDDIEIRLTAICAEILNINKEAVGINANFFELGGNSLNLISLISKIYREFGCELPVAQLFKNPRIEHIAHLIKSGKYIEEEFVLLEQSTPEPAPTQIQTQPQKILFCFPPRIGFGVSYQALAAKVPGYTCCAFNFIEHENPLARYADIIIQRQPAAPYVMLGWSAAGRLMFKVTAELEQRGYRVSDIILIDSRWDTSIYRDSQWGEKQREMIGQIGKSMAEIGLEFWIDRVKRKMEAYTRYGKELTHLDRVHAHVHLILSEENRENVWASGWKRFTNKTFTLYQGFGGHEDMLLPGPALEKNAALIREILEKVFFQGNNKEKHKNKKENN